MSVASRESWNTSLFVAEALRLEMARDENVLMLGEDVGRNGGVFGSSRGLLDKFGAM